MIVEVNFRYDAAVLGARRRNAWDRIYLGTVPVEVREIPAAEAPVAMRFVASRYEDSAPGAELRLRWFEGELYKPLFEVGPDDRRSETPPTVTPRTAPWVEACAASDCNKDYNYGPFPSGSRSYRAETVKRIEEDLEVAKVVKTDHDKMAAKQREAAERLILVDGEAYQRCPEPVYVFKHGGFRGESWVNTEFYNESSHERGEHVYRVDELHVLKARYGGDSISVNSPVEIDIPAAVRNEAPHRLVIARVKAVKDRMQNEIANRDVEYFAQFAIVRDALIEQKVDVPDASPDAVRLAGVLRDVLEAVPGIDGWAREQSEEALARLDALSLSDEMAFLP